MLFDAQRLLLDVEQESPRTTKLTRQLLETTNNTEEIA